MRREWDRDIGSGSRMDMCRNGVPKHTFSLMQLCVETSMKLTSMNLAVTALIAVGAMALAAPASAQLVNGLTGPDYFHDAPIGTKAGGAVSTLKAPGEAAAIAGALANEREARNMGRVNQPLMIKSTMFKPAVTKAGASKTAALRPSRTARNEITDAKLRLDLNSD
jgi:hypothetical protein